MKISRRILLLLAATVVCVAGAGVVWAVFGVSFRPGVPGYIEIHRDGLAKFAAAKELNAHYPLVDNFITQYNVERLSHEWQTEAFIEGRFILTVVIPISIDYSRGTVTQSGVPKFYLNAVNTIYAGSSDKNWYNGAQFDPNLDRKFGEVEWNQFVRSGFDLTRLGIPKSEIRPVAHWQEYVRAVRSPRVPIN